MKRLAYDFRRRRGRPSAREVNVARIREGMFCLLGAIMFAQVKRINS